MQPYGIVKDVSIEFQDSSTLVDFMVMDMDPLTHQECHDCCNKFSNRTGDLNLQIWTRSCSQTENVMLSPGE
jgi:hypothetical protein